MFRVFKIFKIIWFNGLSAGNNRITTRLCVWWEMKIRMLIRLTHVMTWFWFSWNGKPDSSTSKLDNRQSDVWQPLRTSLYKEANSSNLKSSSSSVNVNNVQPQNLTFRRYRKLYWGRKGISSLLCQHQIDDHAVLVLVYIKPKVLTRENIWVKATYACT